MGSQLSEGKWVLCPATIKDVATIQRSRARLSRRGAAKNGRQSRSRIFRSGHAYGEIRALLAEVQRKGMCLDLPAGRGVNLPGIRDAGFEPVAADLYPEDAKTRGVWTVKTDFNSPLPFADGSFAAVLCSEGIEHHPAQARLLQEFARVLQPAGALLITTPNVLNLRARFSTMLNGHYSFKRAPVSEVTGIWKSGGHRPYVGHVHMLGYFELRFILMQAGFVLTEVTTAKYAISSIMLAPFLWLPVRIATTRLFRRYLRGHPEIYREICAHALSPVLLFGKKLIVLAQKAATTGDASS